jgi:hypothetical protein
MPNPIGRTRRAKMRGRVRIADCNGIDSNKTGELVSWSHPDADKIAREYPFVGGRTPQGMGWVAVRLDDGTVTTVPKNRVFQVETL